jgi:hypothetical protein
MTQEKEILIDPMYGQLLLAIKDLYLQAVREFSYSHRDKNMFYIGSSFQLARKILMFGKLLELHNDSLQDKGLMCYIKMHELEVENFIKNLESRTDLK